MVVAQQQQPMTLDQFLQIPEQEPPLELFQGGVTPKMSPKLRHGVLEYQACRMVNDTCVPSRLTRAVPEVRTNFAGYSVIPDVSIFAWDRIPVDEHGEVPDEVWIAPDIAIEIASPGQSISSLIERCRIFVTDGVRAVVLVVPRNRTVGVFRADSEMLRLSGRAAVDLTDVVPTLCFTVDELFAALRARPGDPSSS